MKVLCLFLCLYEFIQALLSWFEWTQIWFWHHIIGNEDTTTIRYGWGDGFIVDMRRRTVKGIWKGPDWTEPVDSMGPWEVRETERWGKNVRAREKWGKSWVERNRGEDLCNPLAVSSVQKRRLQQVFCYRVGDEIQSGEAEGEVNICSQPTWFPCRGSLWVSRNYPIELGYDIKKQAWEEELGEESYGMHNRWVKYSGKDEAGDLLQN